MQAQPMILPQGDFARGMRAISSDAGSSFVRGDFAGGLRTSPESFSTRTFATGQATQQASVSCGHFATGQSGAFQHARVRHSHPDRHGHHAPSVVGAPVTETGLS
jgi:hypothetical protein